ncbi:MAG TPA: HAD-IA family hydrolase, partial [Marmoricola sp.]|nr:HAD-IA family hydrolase [Marmoricola sp.]
AGKPERALFDETLARVGGERPLVVGDRLDTDIDGARNVGWDSLLVMTGVTTLRELAALANDSRPTYVAADLGALSLPGTAADVDGSSATLGGWTARVEDGRLDVRGDGDAHDWWRAVAASLWAHLDATGVPADPDDAVAPRVALPT